VRFITPAINRLSRTLVAAALVSWFVVSVPPSAVVWAQEPAPPGHMDMDMGDMKMDMTPNAGWRFMQDGILFAVLDHQGSPRGGNAFVAPNWWMGMADRQTSHGRWTFTSMLSLDPATVGRDGYGEIFQVGEALNGRPLVDRQHPHDFFMQLAAVWRTSITSATGLTLAGGPVGEPALGPVAFMHRASALDNPTAPLSHHTFDSTHISYGVLTAAVDHGPWAIEGSVFNGREPDDHRWDFDFGRLDSVSARIWFRPTSAWEMQVSTGHLTNPETLEPGNIERSTASAAWTRTTGKGVAALTVGIGRNDTTHGARHAAFLEGARHRGANTVYGRFEALQVETALLLTDIIIESGAADRTDPVVAMTMGGVRDLPTLFGVEGGLGADVTFYRVPDSLYAIYGAHPVSFHVFLRLRAPAGAMGRMWNMRMSQPMGAHAPH
jgi:hypothetical protein